VIREFGSILTSLALVILLKSWIDDARQQRDRQRNGISNVKANGEFISTIASSRDQTIFVSSTNRKWLRRLRPA
jgi:hypothetical protein